MPKCGQGESPRTRRYRRRARRPAELRGWSVSGQTGVVAASMAGRHLAMHGFGRASVVGERSQAWIDVVEAAELSEFACAVIADVMARRR